MSSDDQILLARAASGDGEALDALMSRYASRVYRLAYGITRSSGDAEEVVQEAFLRAYRQLHRFEQRANFGTWIYRITANCAVDLVRSRGRHQDRRVTDAADLPEAVSRLAADDPPPDRLVYNAEVQQRLRDALGGLTARERAAFMLRHFEGLSIDQIGQTLNMKTNATKHSIFRAVRKVRAALEPLNP